MDTLQNMRVLIRVVESGSFTAAGKSLNVTTSVISRAVSDLETHLRTRLLTRTTRRFALTPAGERYIERCRKILGDLESAEEEASNAMGHPTGTLRLFAFASLGQQYVLPGVVEYKKQYPDIKCELTLLQHVPDLYDGSIDVAVVAAASLPDSDVVSHLIGSSVSVLCAAPSYIAKNGSPQTPADLLDHDCLTLKIPAFPADEWTLENGQEKITLEIDSKLQVNVAESMAYSIRAGLGIGMLPMYSAVSGLKDKSLVRVLPGYTLQRLNIYVMYSSRKYVDAKTRTWVEFIRRYLPTLVEADSVYL